MFNLLDWDSIQALSNVLRARKSMWHNVSIRVFSFSSLDWPSGLLPRCFAANSLSLKRAFEVPNLVAPYCAIPRDYLSDTPLLRAMGFLLSQHGQLGVIPPCPFLSVSPLEGMRSGGAIPPYTKGGISAILARCHMKTRHMGAIPLLCVTISKRYCAIWGWVSRIGPLRSPNYFLGKMKLIYCQDEI